MAKLLAKNKEKNKINFDLIFKGLSLCKSWLNFFEENFVFKFKI